MKRIAFLPRNEHHFAVFEDICVALKSHQVEAILLSQFGESKYVKTINFLSPMDAVEKKNYSHLIEKYSLFDILNKYIYADRDLTFFPRYFRTFRKNHKKNIENILGIWLYQIDEFFEYNSDIKVIFSELKAGLFDGIFHEIAKFHGVDYLSIRQSKLTNGVIVCDPDHDLPHPNVKSKNNPDIDQIVNDYINNQRLKYDEPSYLEVTKNNHKLDFKMFPDIFNRIFFSCKRRNIFYIFRQIFIPIRWAFAKLINRITLKLNRADIFLSEIDHRDKYLIYPLHYEPESSVTVRGFPHEQIFLIKLISKSLPYGYKLYVKEHKGNRGYRKFADYLDIQSLHNVELILPEMNSFDLVKNSSGVLTITGRMGWEALLIGKPVLSFGKSFWSNLESVHKVTEIEHLNTQIKKLLDTGLMKNDDEIKSLVKFYIERTFPGNFVMKSSQLRTKKNIKVLTDLILKILA